MKSLDSKLNSKWPPGWGASSGSVWLVPKILLATQMLYSLYSPHERSVAGQVPFIYRFVQHENEFPSKGKEGRRNRFVLTRVMYQWFSSLACCITTSLDAQGVWTGWMGNRMEFTDRCQIYYKGSVYQTQYDTHKVKTIRSLSVSVPLAAFGRHRTLMVLSPLPCGESDQNSWDHRMVTVPNKMNTGVVGDCVKIDIYFSWWTQMKKMSYNTKRYTLIFSIYYTFYFSWLCEISFCVAVEELYWSGNSSQRFRWCLGISVETVGVGQWGCSSRNVVDDSWTGDRDGDFVRISSDIVTSYFTQHFVDDGRFAVWMMWLAAFRTSSIVRKVRHYLHRSFCICLIVFQLIQSEEWAERWL